MKPVHGARVFELGGNPAKALDYSNTLHPGGPPEGLIRAASEGLSAFGGFYPDVARQGVHRAMARRLKLPEKNLLLTHGASEALQLLARTTKFPVRILAEDYGEYAAELERDGAPYRAVPFHLENPKATALLEDLRHTEEVWLSQPHNPTGVRFSPKTLDRLIQQSARLVVDVSLDLSQGEVGLQRWLARLKTTPNLVVALSLTKWFSCPGLRIGLVAAHPKIIQRLAFIQSPWTLGQAEIGALKWIAANPWPEPPSRKAVKAFQKNLEALGAVVLDQGCHYFLLKPPGDSQALALALRKEQMLVRDVGNTYWRLRSLGEGPDARFVAALERAMGGKGQSKPRHAR